MPRRKKKINYLFLATALILTLMGLVILASASTALSLQKYNQPFYFLKHQIIFGIIPGIFLAVFLFFIPLEYLKKKSLLFLIINLALVAMVFLPKIGMESGGAKRWILLGNFSFQPSEFLKLTFILYISSWLTSRIYEKEKFSREKAFKNQKKDFSQNFFAFVIVIGVLAGLLLSQPDTSTLGVIVITGAIIFFLSETPFRYTIFLSLITLFGLFLAIKFAPYRMKRWLVFLNPEIDPLGIGYQLKQALIAVGSGGIFGLGIGFSRQKFGFLPHSISDSIFAIFAEETGFFGALILILLFLLFFWQSIKIGMAANDRFSQLTAWGIGTWILIQAFINIGAMIRVLPLSGIPLPFISYGGSAIVAELAAVGILLNISKNAN